MPISPLPVARRCQMDDGGSTLGSKHVVTEAMRALTGYGLGGGMRNDLIKERQCSRWCVQGYQHCQPILGLEDERVEFRGTGDLQHLLKPLTGIIAPSLHLCDLAQGDQRATTAPGITQLCEDAKALLHHRLSLPDFAAPMGDRPELEQGGPGRPG